jgi:hypothetical protein
MSGAEKFVIKSFTLLPFMSPTIALPAYSTVSPSERSTFAASTF